MYALILRMILLAGLLAPLAASAYTLEQFKFEDPARTERFRTLLGELRCVVCQNETLAASQADVAQIMREEVYRLAQEGKGEPEIKEHLVERYGDFVLYDPPFKLSTLIVWVGPFVLVLLATGLMVRMLLSQGAAGESELTEEERRRLDDLIARSQAGYAPPAAPDYGKDQVAKQ